MDEKKKEVEASKVERKLAKMKSVRTDTTCLLKVRKAMGIL